MFKRLRSGTFLYILATFDLLSSMFSNAREMCMQVHMSANSCTIPEGLELLHARTYSSFEINRSYTWIVIQGLLHAFHDSECLVLFL
jgi:hypothetical protein